MTLVEIGIVTRAHGIRGEVRVKLHWAESPALHGATVIWLQRARGAAEARDIVSVRSVDKGALIRLRGVEDRDAAERLRGSTLSLPREALPALAAGEYYLCDLVGARVLGPAGEVGRVLEARSHPSVDTILVELLGGAHVEQPLVEPWIQTVDVAEGIVLLSSLDGMIGP